MFLWDFGLTCVVVIGCGDIFRGISVSCVADDEAGFTYGPVPHENTLDTLEVGGVKVTFRQWS